jgi:hypothetical protein
MRPGRRRYGVGAAQAGNRPVRSESIGQSSVYIPRHMPCDGSPPWDCSPDHAWRRPASPAYQDSRGAAVGSRGHSMHEYFRRPWNVPLRVPRCPSGRLPARVRWSPVKRHASPFSSTATSLCSPAVRTAGWSNRARWNDGWLAASSTAIRNLAHGTAESHRAGTSVRVPTGGCGTGRRRRGWGEPPAGTAGGAMERYISHQLRPVFSALTAAAVCAAVAWPIHGLSAKSPGTLHSAPACRSESSPS